MTPTEIAVKALDAALELNRQRVNSAFKPEGAARVEADAKRLYAFLTDPNK